MKRGFTLVELLIVLIIAGILYALVFSKGLTPPRKDNKIQKGEITLLLNRMRQIVQSDHRNIMAVFKEDGSFYVVHKMQPLFKGSLKTGLTQYILYPDETIEEAEYPMIRIGRDEFRPVACLELRPDGLFLPFIYKMKERWHYLHPFGTFHRFVDPEEMVALIRQKAYLPNIAGYAQ